MNDRLRKIKTAVISDNWENGEFVQFKYNSQMVWHQIVSLYYDGGVPYLVNAYCVDLVDKFDRFPVVSKGLTSYVIQCLGGSERQIFINYYFKCRDLFVAKESTKPGSSMRDLVKEFYSFHLSEEKKNIKLSEQLYLYLDNNEGQLLKDYIDSYFVFIEKEFCLDEKNAELCNSFEFKVSTVHHVLVYLFEVTIAGEELLLGKKSVIESLGNQRLGAGRGNTFYKIFNKIARNDLTSEEFLVEVGGEHWRKIILEISTNSEDIEAYLDSVGL